MSWNEKGGEKVSFESGGTHSEILLAVKNFNDNFGIWATTYGCRANFDWQSRAQLPVLSVVTVDLPLYVRPPPPPPGFSETLFNNLESSDES